MFSYRAEPQHLVMMFDCDVRSDSLLLMALFLLKNYMNSLYMSL